MQSFLESIKNTYRSIRKQAEENTANTANHVKKWASHMRLAGIIDYRKADYNELLKVITLHKQYLKSDKSDILALDEAKKAPQVNEHHINSALCYEDYDNRGDLSTLMSALSKIITSCVNARLSAAEAEGYNHLNGAAILFCAEMCQWINTMGKQSIDTKMLEIVIKRVQYLDALLENEVFENEPKTDYAIDLLIFNLSSILEKLVKPQIQAKLNSNCSREFFDNLNKQTKTFFTRITHGLYTVYSGQEKNISALYNFEVTNTLIHSGFKKGFETSLGKLFNELSCISMDPKNYLQIENAEQDRVIERLGDNLKDKNSKSHGLDLIMIERPELIQHLIDMFDLLKKFCLLMSAFKQFYSLSGDGGDILIYIALCQETNAIIACYSQLCEQILRKIDAICTVTSQIMTDLIKNQQKTPWRSKYLSFKKDIELAKEALSECNIQINHIITQMQKVSSRDYVDEVKSKIDNLRKILAEIERDLSLTVSFQTKNIIKNDLIIENNNSALLLTDKPCNIKQRGEKALNTSIKGNNTEKTDEISFAELIKKRQEQKERHQKLLEKHNQSEQETVQKSNYFVQIKK